MKQKSPAFRFYASDFLMDEKVRLMNLQERGALITLMAHCWIEKSIPSNLDELATLCNTDVRDFEVVWEKVSKCFHGRGKRLTNNRLELERVKQRNFSRQQQEKAVKMHKKYDNTESTVDAMAEPRQSNGIAMALPARTRFSLSLSSSISKQQKKQRTAFKPPTPEEVTKYAQAIGFSELNVNKFFDHYETVGWVYGKDSKPIKSWEACVRTWKGRDSDAAGKVQKLAVMTAGLGKTLD